MTSKSTGCDHYHETANCCHANKEQIKDHDVERRFVSCPNQLVFRIDGMDCADCAQKLEKKVGALSSVTQVSVNFGAAKMTVEHDGSARETVMKTVKKAGYTATEDKGTRSGQTDQPFWRRNRKALPTLISGILFLLALIPSTMGEMSETTAAIIYGAAMVVGGFRIAKSGLYGLKSRTIGMDLLMIIAAVGAACIGEWSEGAAVVFLFSLGETLEAFTMDRTRRSIRSLMDLAPNTAVVKRNGQETTLDVENILVGDVIVVKPGEKIAMDGDIVNGFSSVNQAPITGESIPVEKVNGDEVFAGTINQEGSLEVKVTKRSQDNTLSRIIHMVEEAQAQKAPSQRFVDVFAKYYTPAVIVIAVGIALIPPVFFNQAFETWFYRALMMLVVSCPCALVISTPVSIVSAIGNAARNGILIKGGAHLERLGAISTIAFDKTGTLTSGIPRVAEVIPFGELKREEVLALAASIEKHSEHPVAKAIVRQVQEENLAVQKSTQFTSVTGKGAKAEIKGVTHYIGNPRWLLEQQKESAEATDSRIRSFEQKGQTVMALWKEDRVLGLLTVADTIRENSTAAVNQLRQIGIHKVVMLTGDNQGTAKAIADQIGQMDYRAELLPQDKMSAVQELARKDKGVAMVGDGINDAPALATANVGIAMGAAGTDTALETADVALMADDLSKLPYAVGLSRRALKIIKQNIAFSLLVKVVFLGLIFLGWSTLWMAVLADTGSSLIVIANGMRLLRSKQVQATANRSVPTTAK